MFFFNQPLSRSLPPSLTLSLSLSCAAPLQERGQDKHETLSLSSPLETCPMLIEELSCITCKLNNPQSLAPPPASGPAYESSATRLTEKVLKLLAPLYHHCITMNDIKKYNRNTIKDLLNPYSHRFHISYFYSKPHIVLLGLQSLNVLNTTGILPSKVMLRTSFPYSHL